LFTTDEERAVRARLAGSMRYILTQRLVPAISGERLLVTELMGSNLRTREVIAEGENESRQLDDIIEAGTVSGWHSFEQSLIRAYEQDLITKETALLYCTNKMRMLQRIDNLYTSASQKTVKAPPVFTDLKMREQEKTEKAEKVEKLRDKPGK